MLRRRWKPNAILIEAVDAGRALHDDLRKTKSVGTILLTPRGDEVTRVAGITGEVEEAQFVLPEEAPWLAAFRNELRALPDGKHDDQVDALSRFVIRQRQHWRSLLESVTPPGADDTDARTQTSLAHYAEKPLEGWRTWSEEIVAACVTHEAADRVQARHSGRLRTLSKTDGATYARVS